MIGFIGLGHLSTSIINGLLASGMDAKEIVIANRTFSKAEQYSEKHSVIVARSNTSLVEKVGENGIVILAVKPDQMRGVVEEIKDIAGRLGTTLVSVAAGIRLDDLESWAGENHKICRTLPNVASEVQESMTGIAFNTHVDLDTARTVKELFSIIGRVEEIEDHQFSAFSAIASCSPAFTYEFIDALSRAAVKNGIPKKQAERIATQAVFGSALLALNSPHDVAHLSNTVQSPGGTTVAGVVEMEESGFRAAVMRGVQASIARDKELR